MRWNLQSLVTVLLLFLALLLANFLSVHHFGRADLTESHAYTLSSATRQILGKVDDAITIKAYFSEKFPPALLPLRRDVSDLLAEIKAAGRGLVTVEYVDPGEDKELIAELEKSGVRTDPIQILEKDQVQAVQVWKSLVLYHADKKEVIPSLMSVADLEYNIAVAIKKLSLEKPLTVAFLGFKDGPSTYNELAPIEPEVKKLYDVDTAVVTGGKPISEDIKTLIAVRPKGLSPRSAYEIDQFLMRGGKAVFLVDGIDVNLRSNPPRPEPITSGLEEMLEAYGIKVEKNLVFDRACETVRVQVRQGIQMMTPYPPLVAAIHQNFDKTSPVVSHISKIPLPWVSSITVTDKAKPYQVIPLVKSTGEAWIPPEPIELAPDRLAAPKSQSDLGQRLLAVAVAGTIKSAWAGKEPPPPEGAPDVKNPEPARKDEGETRFIVVGDSDFVMGNFMSPGGVQFLLNALDWMTLDDSLIGIRTKSEKGRPLPLLSTAQKAWFRAFTIGLAPVLVTLLGIGRYLLRRRRQDVAGVMA